MAIITVPLEVAVFQLIGLRGKMYPAQIQRCFKGVKPWRVQRCLQRLLEQEKITKSRGIYHTWYRQNDGEGVRK